MSQTVSCHPWPQPLSCDVTGFESITTFRSSSSSKTRLAMDYPELIKKEALVELMLGQDQDTLDSRGKATL